LILAALVLGVPATATEPDGRVAFRFAWPDGKDGGAPRLRLTMTAVSPLTNARLTARLPAGVGLSLHDAAGGGWPEAGLELGTFAAGRTVVVEFDIAKPERGGGIVSFVLEATSDGRQVTEGVGVPVGLPGTEPTLRNGAVEFPAAKPDAAP
jgi:hypothetical protein